MGSRALRVDLVDDNLATAGDEDDADSNEASLEALFLLPEFLRRKKARVVRVVESCQHPANSAILHLMGVYLLAIDVVLHDKRPGLPECLDFRFSSRRSSAYAEQGADGWSTPDAY